MESNSKPLVLIVGRLSGPKNGVILNTIGRAVPEIIRAFPGARIEILGSPVQDEHRELEAQYPFVRFGGFQPALRPFYEKADLVIASGRSALEAMALKKPVVAVGERFYVGPISEETFEKAKSTNFGDCFESEVFNWPQMSRDIIQLLCDEAWRQRVADAGHRLVRAEYDMKKVYPQIEKAYARALLENNLSLQREIPVLMYHRVVERPPSQSRFNLYVTKADFTRQLLFLKRRGFQTLTFSDLLSVRLPAKPVILTFDDGYRDNYDVLFPLLKQYGAKAVIFVLGNRNVEKNIWDMDRGEPEAPLLNSQQILEMAQSEQVEFGAHSMEHRNLDALSEEERTKEIRGCKKALEAELGRPVISFAYPYGNFNETVKKSVADAGFTFGLAVDKGPARFGADLFAIHRIQIFPHTTPFQFYKKTSGFYLRYRSLLGR